MKTNFSAPSHSAWAVALAVLLVLVYTTGLVVVMRQGSPVAEAALSPVGLASGSSRAMTVTSGDATPTGPWMTIAAAGDLSRLWAGSGYAVAGDLLVISTSDNAQDVTVWDGVASSGSMQILQLGAATRALDNSLDVLILFYDGTVWREVAFVSNGS